MIFDLDGTLGNTLPVCIEAFQITFREYLGKDYAPEEIRAMFGPTEEGIFQRLLPERHAEAMAMFLREYERAHARCGEPFSGLPELLARLREKSLRLGVVTGKGPESTEVSLRVLGLDPFFDDVQSGSAKSGIKPACIRELLERWELDRDEVAYVGDVPYDIRSGREVGVLAVAAAWAETADVEALMQEEPDQLFRTIEEFGAWVETVTGNGVRRSGT